MSPKTSAGKTQNNRLVDPERQVLADIAADSPDFAGLHGLLRGHAVTVAMTGQTHAVEYDTEKGYDSARTVHHFGNGGTALAWPARPVW